MTQSYLQVTFKDFLSISNPCECNLGVKAVSTHPGLEEVIVDIKQSWQCDADVHHHMKHEACVDVDKTQLDTTLLQVLHQKRCIENTHPFNGHFSGTTRVSRYQKDKTNLDFTEARELHREHSVGYTR